MIHHILHLGQPYALSTNALLAVLLSGARVQLASKAKGTPEGSQEPARGHGSEKAAPIADGIAMLFNGKYPLVPLFCNDPRALWHGRWHFNCSTDYVEAIGGPFATKQQAIAAALGNGWRLRIGTTDHLEPHN